ncbi:DUF1304 domain-containing protein [Nocardiopsis sp. NRRL B-16309]|uniref:DUF1304 domain-containing protein n=1 Tax=Nocardiopsis sp. NRRL B-16309 TaxID=1519494 RepID=UPI0006B00E39|nr:DUF1304 domain-containing protein [Nocardiopsis sp. NRRL B-16309]KOX08810.1 epimerase [Nocardiopsis sp. NRRL B-16309]
MLIIGLAFALVGALVHVYIFVLESVLWTSPRARAVFGTTEEQARATRELAFNQGFYNLFLAVAVVLGAVLIGAGLTSAGAALVYAGAGSMVLAGTVLAVSSPRKLRPALIQLGPPLAGVALLTLGLAW